MSAVERAFSWFLSQAILLALSIAGLFLSHGPNVPPKQELIFALPFLVGSIVCAVAAIRNTKLKYETTAAEFARYLIRLISIPLALYAIAILFLMLTNDIWMSA